MEDLITRFADDENIRTGIERMKLATSHPRLKIGQTICFTGGYERDIRFKSKITGFDRDGGIYVLWDCYWFPIKDDEGRDIEIIG